MEEAEEGVVTTPTESSPQKKSTVQLGSTSHTSSDSSFNNLIHDSTALPHVLIDKVSLFYTLTPNLLYSGLQLTLKHHRMKSPT